MARKYVPLTFGVHCSHIDFSGACQNDKSLVTRENNLEGFVAFEGVIHIQDVNFNVLIDFPRSKCYRLPIRSFEVFRGFGC